MAIPKRRYSFNELKAKQTLCVGQADDLKYDDGKHRIWLERMTVGDYHPDSQDDTPTGTVTVEEYIDGCWETIDTYTAL